MEKIMLNSMIEEIRSMNPKIFTSTIKEAYLICLKDYRLMNQ
jgi:hypothetical protein